MFGNNSDITKAVIIGASTAVIGATTAFLDNYNSRAKRCNFPKRPYVNRDGEREAYINSILYCGDTHCLGQIRMRPIAFFRLCEILVERNLLNEGTHVSVREQVLMFLHIIGHNLRFRIIGGRFHRSIWTVHYYFHIVLKAILKLYPDFVKPASTLGMTELRNNSRFFPWFEDCLGAIDGTLVRASVPIEAQSRFRGRKGGITQNLMVAVSFDLMFTYVLAGWEGSAHDSKVLNHALSKDFKVPEGKFYLVDAGYGLRNGFIPPYRRVRYHLQEFSDRPPENTEELFNLRHCSLRTSIERAFGILKKRFRVLDAEPFWDYDTQVEVVLACCVIHNYLRGVDPNDPLMTEVDVNAGSSSQSRNTQLSQHEERRERRGWGRKRDAIANAMWTQYTRDRSLRA